MAGGGRRGGEEDWMVLVVSLVKVCVVESKEKNRGLLLVTLAKPFSCLRVAEYNDDIACKRD